MKNIEPKTNVTNADKNAINFAGHSIEFDVNNLNSIKSTSFYSSTLENKENLTIDGNNSSMNVKGHIV